MCWHVMGAPVRDGHIAEAPLPSALSDHQPGLKALHTYQQATQNHHWASHHGTTRDHIGILDS